jgi:DNA-binding YbaB/EbfC family protein
MDITALMRQAQELKKNFEQTQAELEQMTLSGSGGGGMVTAEVNGMGQIKRLKLDATAVNPNDIEMLEDLIVVAISDAQNKAMTEAKLRGGKLGEGMNLPFTLPF